MLSSSNNRQLDPVDGINGTHIEDNPSDEKKSDFSDSFFQSFSECQFCTILEFLEAAEVLQISYVCKQFDLFSRHNSLWVSFVVRDFSFGLPDFDRITFHRQNAKIYYFDQLMLKKNRFTAAVETDRSNRLNRAFEYRSQKIEKCVSFLNQRFLQLLSVILIELSFIFIALKLDNHIKWPAWLVLCPIWILLSIFSLLYALDVFIFSFRHNSNSIFHLAFGEMHGIIFYVFRNVFEVNGRAICGGALLLGCVATFVVLVAVKLSLIGLVSWPVVFIPIWFGFGLTCLSPWMQWSMSYYCTCLVLVWVPMLIFFILLISQLHRSANLQVELILIPFWVVQALLLGTISLEMSHWIIREGLARRHNHQFIVQMVWRKCGLVWAFVVPIILFQILLCLYSRGGYGITALAVFSPLVALFGAMLYVMICIPEFITFTDSNHTQDTGDEGEGGTTPSALGIGTFPGMDEQDVENGFFEAEESKWSYSSRGNDFFGGNN